MSQFSPDEARQIKTSLRDIDDMLGRVTATADHDFITIGNSLSHSVEVFGRLSGSLTGLAEELQSQDAANAVAALEQAADGIGRMSGGSERIDTLLAKLEEEAVGVAKYLDLLGKIIGEVGSLAINGKIQAAQVASSGVDFSVFTTEIGRLGNLAASSTQKASGRLTDVRAAVSSARHAAADFERNEAVELAAVRNRIQNSLSLLAERRQRAGYTADSVAGKSRDITQRIAKTVGELQINDSVCQRLEHVRSALQDMACLAVNEPAPHQDSKWLTDIAQDRHRSLIGGICHLQAAQLEGGASDYQTEVEGLIRNLSALSTNAGDILAEAEASFGSGNGGLFVAEIEQDVRRATELLTAYAAARERADSVVSAVADGFRAMAEDLASIQSIDADMRIMGLNATLKCSRLGNEGRALGVVAHELRACSKRTEDCTHIIADLLQSVLALADALAVASAEDSASGAEDPAEIMSSSLSALSAMGLSMADALSGLRGDAGQVSSTLKDTADSIDIHHRLGSVAKDGANRLSQLANGLASEADLEASVHQEIHRLMQSRYTMNRERLIHQTFARDDSAAAATQESQAGSGDDLEDMFL
jgi:hypothetical protein